MEQLISAAQWCYDNTIVDCPTLELRIVRFTTKTKTIIYRNANKRDKCKDLAKTNDFSSKRDRFNETKFSDATTGDRVVENVRTMRLFTFCALRSNTTQRLMFVLSDDFCEPILLLSSSNIRFFTSYPNKGERLY